MVMKEMIFNTFLVVSILTVLSFGRVMVMKEMIFNILYFGRMWWS